MNTESNGLIARNLDVVGVVLATASVLLLPLVAMQFTDEVKWTLGDFVAAGVLLGGTGLAYVFAARKNPQHRLVIGAVLAAALVFVWIQLAVGIFGD